MPARNPPTYQPLQPAAAFSGRQVCYTEFPPHPALRSCIYCYWELRSGQLPDSNFPYRVVADGCIDIFFDRNDPGQSFVMGCSNSFTDFMLGSSFHYAGIRFLPAQFPLLFPLKASELSNRSEMLEIVVPKLARYLREQAADNRLLQEPDTTLWNKLDQYFLQHLSRVEREPDHRFQEALQLILDSAGNLQVQTELDTGISPRQLRRLFDYYIGETPKTFSKIVRFQHLLRHAGSNLRKDKTFFDAGYYDQAHFIRDFRHFYGDTPGKVLR